MLYVNNLINCIGCGACNDIETLCPAECIYFDNDEQSIILNDNCIECYACSGYLNDVCPAGVKINSFAPLSNEKQTIMNISYNNRNIAGQYQYESSMDNDVKNSLNQCITLEELYTTRCELNKIISQSYRDNQIVKQIDIVPKLSNSFNILSRGIKTAKFGDDGGAWGGTYLDDWSSLHLKSDITGDKSDGVTYDIENNTYTFNIGLGEEIFNEFEDPNCYSLSINGFILNFISPWRYIIPSNATSEEIYSKESVVSLINKIEYNINHISCDDSIIETSQLSIYCRKLKKMDTKSDVIGAIESHNEELYSNSDGSRQLPFAELESLNRNNTKPGSGFMLEVVGLNIGRNGKRQAYINGSFYTWVEIDMDVNLELLYDVDNINHLYYHIILNIGPLA